MSGRRAFFGLLFIAALACACSDPEILIAPRWKYDAAGDGAPPGLGPERRVVFALRSGQGGVVTLNEDNGREVEGPFTPIFPTEHAPIVSDSKIFIVSSIGKLVAIDFAGEMKLSKPDGAPLGKTGPLALAPDGSLRIATTSGRLLGFKATDGSTMFDRSIGGAATSALAIAGDGTAFAATDLGRVAGVDAAGAVTFDVTVNAPASGPSVASSGRVAIGELDGVRVFERDGSEVFRHPRLARVVGTRFLDSGELMAWGEDGVFELLDASGGVIGSFAPGPPIYTPAVPLESGKFAVLDSMGTGYLVNREGKEEARIELGGVPLRELAVGASGFVFVTIGATVRAFDFTSE